MIPNPYLTHPTINTEIWSLLNSLKVKTKVYSWTVQQSTNRLPLHLRGVPLDSRGRANGRKNMFISLAGLITWEMAFHDLSVSSEWTMPNTRHQNSNNNKKILRVFFFKRYFKITSYTTPSNPHPSYSSKQVVFLSGHWMIRKAC